jgi:hypothetical protein
VKEIKASNGETELQSAEYAPIGPVRVDVAGEILALRKRIETLEMRVASLLSQSAIYGPK